MHIFLRTCALCLACLLTAQGAHAICAIGFTPKIWVGDVASDSKCTANTIQAAIDDAVCPTQIIITGGHIYTEQHLTIINKTVELVGSTGQCGADAPTSTAPVRTISGMLGASVIAIGGNSNVSLRSVEVTHGDEGSGSEGGGIFFGGAGSLTLEATTVDGNTADFGGGIDMSPTGSATLTLSTDSLVINNFALTSGGGIRIEGDTRLFMLTDGSSVSFNHALSGYGGGIEILGPARADIGSSGAIFVGAISNNDATYGGGIAVLGSSHGDAAARLFTTNATTPVEVNGNSATEQGGGVFVLADGDGADGTTAFLCGQDFRIDLNTAPDGAAIYATDDDGFGTGVTFNSSQCGPEPASALGAIPCAANTDCNEISGNAAEDSEGNRSGGSVINMSHYSLAANRISTRQNSGAQIVNLLEGFGNNFFRNCLIVDNQSTGEVIRTDQEAAPLNVDNCTIANNAIDDGYVIFAKDELNLNNDLIAQPNNSTLDYQLEDCSGTCFFANYIISAEVATIFAPAFSLSSSTPLFLDAANSDISKRDYHLRAFAVDGVVTSSPAIDFAPVIGGEGNDRDNNPRGQDVPLVVNRFGLSDVGAYEMRPIADRIFADAFGDATSLVY